MTELLETGMRLLIDPHILITRILARVFMGPRRARIFRHSFRKCPFLSLRKYVAFIKCAYMRSK